MKKILCFVLIMGVLSSLCVFSTFADDNAQSQMNYIYGDVDMNGVVNIKDATAIQKGIAGIEYLTAVQRYLADPNSEGISVRNATAIQKYIADLGKTSSIDEALVMSSQDKFSNGIASDAEYDVDCIIVHPYLNSDYAYEYTLADFPEYEFESIESVGSKEKGYIIYFLYLKEKSKENVIAALKALDYRANIDLETAFVNYISVGA